MAMKDSVCLTFDQSEDDPFFCFVLGEILLASDSLSRVLAQYDRLVKQDHLIKDDNVLSLIEDIPPTSTPHTLIDLAGSSNSKSFV